MTDLSKIPTDELQQELREREKAHLTLHDVMMIGAREGLQFAYVCGLCGWMQIRVKSEENVVIATSRCFRDVVEHFEQNHPEHRRVADGHDQGLN